MKRGRGSRLAVETLLVTVLGTTGRVALPQSSRESPATRPAAASAPASRWLTELGETVLSRCDLVVLARVEKATLLGNGACVGLLRVERRLDRGAVPERVVVLGTKGDFLPAGEDGGADLFLLDRKGERCGLAGRIAAGDPSFASKLAVAEETLAIAAIEDADERLLRTRLFLHKGLAAEDPYLRGNAVLELERWAGRSPDRFSTDDLDRIAAAAAREPAGALRTRLERILEARRAPRGRQ